MSNTWKQDTSNILKPHYQPQNKELTTSTRPKQRICKSEWCPPPYQNHRSFRQHAFGATLLFLSQYSPGCRCTQIPIHYLTGEAIRCHRLQNILFLKTTAAITIWPDVLELRFGGHWRTFGVDEEHDWPLQWYVVNHTLINGRGDTHGQPICRVYWGGQFVEISLDPGAITSSSTFRQTSWIFFS